MRGSAVAAAVLLTAPLAAADLTAKDYASDARALDDLIIANYAYLDRFPGGLVPTSSQLSAERDAVHDRNSLLHYAEDKIAALVDHHAITGSSFKDDWALVPTYADLWIVRDGAAYRIDSVKADSPAAKAGIHAGEALTAIDDVPIAEAIAAFWRPLGLDGTGERGAYAARVLAAGRRDRARHLTIGQRAIELPSLYAVQTDVPPVSVKDMTIRFNNSLGQQATISAFDTVMAKIPDKARITIDLTDTPSGGNTSVARAVMGWFVTKPTFYQIHNLPAEERETGIARQWEEQVLPRNGKHHSGKVVIRVGRWTGSMGEGMAIGLQAIGAQLCGGRMAGLRGAVYDFNLPASGLVVKFPAERLYTVGGKPRETVVPGRCT
jgi:carboxyl-terminal processing protease